MDRLHSSLPMFVALTLKQTSRQLAYKGYPSYNVYILILFKAYSVSYLEASTA